MWLEILGCVASIFLLSGMFVLLGRRILSLIFVNYFDFPTAFRLGAGYFVGLSAFLAAWRLAERAVGSAKMTFWLVLILALIFCLIPFEFKEKFKKSSAKVWVFLTASFLFIAAFQLAFWLQVLPVPADPFDNFGSAHPVRYLNVVEYIFAHDSIPVINQNFGQSLLALAPKYLGFSRPFLALNLWLSVSIFALSIFSFGLFRRFGLGKYKVIWAVFLLMFSNTALSLTHVLSLDSNNPFFMSSYTDATCGLVTFLLFLLFLHELEAGENIRRGFWLLAPVIFGLYWNFSGGQNIILATFLLAGVSIIRFWRGKRWRDRILICTTIFIIFAAVGATMGGMLTPQRFRERISFPGLASVNRPGEYTGIKPELPFAYGWTRDWQYGNPYDPGEKAMYVEILRRGGGLSGSIIHSIVWRLESNLWVALRIMFFPLAGLTAFYFLRRRQKTEGIFSKETCRLWQYALIIYNVGFAFAFLVIVSGRKWEMSRFMIVPYALGLIFFILSFDRLASAIRSKVMANLAIFAVSFIMTIGPLINAAAMIQRNFRDADLAKSKLEFFLRDPGTLGWEVWQEWIKSGLVRP